MHVASRSVQLSSKFVTIYTRLLRGQSPKQIIPTEDPAHFYSNLFLLDVNREFLEGELNKITKDSCLSALKVLVSSLDGPIGLSDPAGFQ